MSNWCKLLLNGLLKIQQRHGAKFGSKPTLTLNDKIFNESTFQICYIRKKIASGKKIVQKTN